MRAQLWGVLAVALAIVVAGCGGSAEPGPEVLSAEFSDFESGQTLTLDDFAGTPLVVNLWSSTCPSCIHEMPDFETVSQELLGEVTFIGINVDSNRGAAAELAAKTGVTYQLGLDDDGMFSVLLGVVAMPTTAFVNASGEVVEVRGGQLSAEALRDQISDHLLASQDVASGSAELTDAVGTSGDTFDSSRLALDPGLFPALNDPAFVPASNATWLDADDIVMGATADSGEAHAYPVDQMAYHHIANSTLAGMPFLVTY